MSLQPTASVDHPGTSPIHRRPPIAVGFVMHVMQVAGAEVLVTQIIERLRGSIAPTVFCLDALGQLGQQLLDQGVPVIVLNRQLGFDASLVKRLALEVRQRKIQVLHAHQYTPFFYSALARGLYGCRAKILFTEHGRHYPDIVSWKRRLVNRFVLQRYADVSTACCDFSAAAVRKKEGLSRTITLVNGVDLTGLPPRGDSQRQAQLRRELGLELDRPYAACIARFHPVKNHRLLMHGWRRVVQAIPSARLLLVGDGPERVAIRQLVSELGIESSVEFWGIRHDVAKILRAVNLFVLTSDSEAASLTLLEAMASECPSVVTAVGGNGEHINDGEHGFLVPRGDAVQLSDRIIQLFQDPQMALSMGQAARRRVTDRFSLSNVIDAYASYYHNLAAQVP